MILTKEELVEKVKRWVHAFQRDFIDTIEHAWREKDNALSRMNERDAEKEMTMISKTKSLEKERDDAIARIVELEAKLKALSETATDQPTNPTILDQRIAMLLAAFARANIRAMGMHAENLKYLQQGKGIAYGEHAFAAIVDEERLGHDTVMRDLA